MESEEVRQGREVKMLYYKKELAMTPHGGALLKNPAPAIAYVEEKI